MSEPMGIPKIQRKPLSNIKERPEKTNLILKKLNESHQFVQPAVKIESEPNSYALSPYVKASLDQNKSSQSSHPVISNNKLQKNIIFKRVKNRISKDSFIIWNYLLP